MADIEVSKANVEVVTDSTAQVVNSVVEPCNVVKDTTMEYTKKEYSIVGDGLYASVTAEEAPQWLVSIIDSVVATGLANGLSDLETARNTIRDALSEVDIARNSYEELINIDATIDGIITSRLTALNASLDQNRADIVTLETTKVSPNEALAIAAEQVSAELNDGSIRSEINRIDYTLATTNSTLATTTLDVEADLEDLATGMAGNATAVTTLNSFVGIDNNNTTGTGLLSDVAILQKQNDGVIETTTGTYDVILNADQAPTDDDELVITAEPYVSWKSIDDANGNQDQRAIHIGDVYIKYTTNVNGGKDYLGAYKFIKTIPDETSPYSTDAEGYTWAYVSDTDAQNAYVAALNAFDLADGKRRVYVGLGATNTPETPYDTGDLWLIDVERTINGVAYKEGDLLRCVETKGSQFTYEQNDWTLATSYRAAINAEADALETWKTNVYGVFVSDIKSQVDKKAESFYQEEQPRVEGTDAAYSKWVGDLWKKPSTNDEYVYQQVGTNYEWVQTDVPDSVFDTIDGKKAIYVGNDLPSPVAPVVLNENDMWITGDIPAGGRDSQSVYIWDGIAWNKPLRYTDDSAVVMLNNGLENGTVAIDLSSATIDGSTPLGDYVADQIDNQVVVYSGTNVATQTGMKTDDIYIEKKVDTNGAVPVDVVNTYKYNGLSWVQIGNNNNLTALADLADGKRSVYAGSTTPEAQGYTPEERDLWIPEGNNGIYVKGEVYQYNVSTWVLATKYTEDLNNFVDITYKPTIATLKNQVDGKIEYLFKANPTSNPLAVVSSGWGEAEHGNVVYYKDTDEGYWYNSNINSFETLTDTSMLSALKKAEDSQATADGKVNSFYGVRQTIAPSVANYKYWLNSADSKLYYYDGSTWIDVATAVDSPVSVGEGDTLRVWDPAEGLEDYFEYFYNSAGTWVQETTDGIVARSGSVTKLATDLLDEIGNRASAITNLENSLDTKITNTGIEAKSNFLYDSDLVINGVTYSSGFGLKSTFTGTPDVNNPPVGTSEFWINAEKFKFTNTGQTGTTTPFSIDASGTTPQVTFNGVVSFTNTDMSSYDNSTVLDSVSDNLVATTGVVPAYGSSLVSNLSYDNNEQAIRLYSSSDDSIGMAFPAFKVNTTTNEKVNLSLSCKSNVNVSSGLYIRVYEYDSDLPAGKTHVSYLASSSSPVVQEATRTIPKSSWKENAAVTTTWVTSDYEYIPSTTAKWASVVILNWTDLGVNSLYVKGYNKSTLEDTSNLALADMSNVTTIDGGKIATGTLDASKITTGTLSVGSADIQDGAITNAKIGSLAVTEAKIGNAAVTNAKIGDASITTAKIGDAQVDTLKIADQAVTIPSSVYSSDSFLAGVNTWSTTQTLSWTSEGYPTMVFVSFEFNGSGAAGSYRHQWRVLHNGASKFNSDYVEETNYVAKTTGINVLVYPSVGVNTIQLQVYSDASGTTHRQRSIMVIEVKK